MAAGAEEAVTRLLEQLHDVSLRLGRLEGDLGRLLDELYQVLSVVRDELPPGSPARTRYDQLWP